MRALFIALLALVAVAHAQNCGDIIVSGSSIDPRYMSCTVATNVKAQNVALTVLSLPKLEKITDSLIVEGNGQMVAIDLPKLTWVDHTVSIQGNSHLQYLTLDRLNYVNTLEYQSNPQHPELELPLTSAYQITIGEGVTRVIFYYLTSVTHTFNVQSSVLTTIGLNVLATVGSGFRLANTETAQTVIIPSLTTVGDLWFENNKHLDTIDCPKLATVTSGLLIQQNPYLFTVKFPALQTLRGSLSLQPIQNLYSCEPTLRASYHAICPAAMKAPSLKKFMETLRNGCVVGMHMDTKTGVCVRDSTA